MAFIKLGGQERTLSSFTEKNPGVGRWWGRGETLFTSMIISYPDNKCAGICPKNNRECEPIETIK